MSEVISDEGLFMLLDWVTYNLPTVELNLFESMRAELMALRNLADAAKRFSDCVASMDDANTVKLGMELDRFLREVGR